MTPTNILYWRFQKSTFDSTAVLSISLIHVSLGGGRVIEISKSLLSPGLIYNSGHKYVERVSKQEHAIKNIGIHTQLLGVTRENKKKLLKYPFITDNY